MRHTPDLTITQGHLVGSETVFLKFIQEIFNEVIFDIFQNYPEHLGCGRNLIAIIRLIN